MQMEADLPDDKARFQKPGDCIRVHLCASVAQAVFVAFSTDLQLGTLAQATHLSGRRRGSTQ